MITNYFDGMPEDLAAIIATHRELFGGFTMTAGATEGASQASEGAVQTSTGAPGQSNQQQGLPGAQKGAEDEWDARSFDPKRIETWHPDARSYVQSLRQEAHTHRTTKEQAVQQARQEALTQLAQQLELAQNGDGNEEQDDSYAQDLAIAQMESTLQRAEVIVWRNAAALGVDAGALTDSRVFEHAVLALDSEADDFETQVQEAARKAAQQNPKLKSGTTPPRGGADFTGGTGERRNSQPLSLEQAVGGYYSR